MDSRTTHYAATAKACHVFSLEQDYYSPIVPNEPAMRSAKGKIFAIRKNSQFQILSANVYQKMGSRKKQEKKPIKIQDKQLKLL